MHEECQAKRSCDGDYCRATKSRLKCKSLLEVQWGVPRKTDIWQRIWRGPVIDRPQTEADGQDGQMEVKVDDELRGVLVWKWAHV